MRHRTYFMSGKGRNGKRVSHPRRRKRQATPRSAAAVRGLETPFAASATMSFTQFERAMLEI
jgi:hypothetical protein